MKVAKYQKDGNPPKSGPGFGVAEHPYMLDPNNRATPYRWKKPRRIFIASMGDLFHKDISDEFIRQVFKVVADNPQHHFQMLTKRSRRLAAMRNTLPWPENLWAGVSIETSNYLTRANHLKMVPASVRFLSLEPLLGPIPNLDLEGIDWVIVGGESGKNRRPMKEEWVLDIKDKCHNHNVPFFFKQWGGFTPKANGRELQGNFYSEFPRELG